MPYTDLTASIATAKRLAGAGAETFWTDSDWASDLMQTAVTVDAQLYFQVYEVAARYVVNPLRVTAQTVGTLSDTYLDPFRVAADLRQQQATDNLRIPPPIDAGAVGGGPDDCIATFGGW